MPPQPRLNKPDTTRGIEPQRLHNSQDTCSTKQIIPTKYKRTAANTTFRVAGPKKGAPVAYSLGLFLLIVFDAWIIHVKGLSFLLIGET